MLFTGDLVKSQWKWKPFDSFVIYNNKSDIKRMKKVAIRKLCLSTGILLLVFQLSAQTILESKKFDAEGIKRIEVKGSYVNISVTS